MAGALLKDLQGMGSTSAHNLGSTFCEQASRMRMVDYAQRLGPFFEAYAWLTNHGLLAPSANSPADFDALTRRAKSLRDGDFNAYRWLWRRN